MLMSQIFKSISIKRNNKMNRNQIQIVGYFTAFAGIAVYLVTKETAGMIFGGTLLILTSIFKIVANKLDCKKRKKKEEKIK